MDVFQPDDSEARSSREDERFISPQVPESPRDFLIGSLYQTAFGIQRFDKCLGALATVFKSQRAFFLGYGTGQRTAFPLLGHNLGQRLTEDYGRLPPEQNLWFRPNSLGSVWRGSEALSHSDLQGFPQFARFLRDHDIGRTLHIEAVRTKDRVMQFALSRPCGSADYDTSDLDLARAVAAHGPRAFNVASTCARMALITNALSHFTEGAGLDIAVVDSSSLLFASDQARRILTEIGASISNGIAAFDENFVSERIRLPRVLSEAIGGLGPKAGTTLLLPCPARESRYVVQARPLNTSEMLQHWKAVGLFMYDPDRQPKSNDEILRLVHDLTSAEARVSSLLAEGWSIEAISEQLSVSAHTVRAHLKKAFEKTGATRQAELVKLVLNSSRLPKPENVVPFSPRPAGSTLASAFRREAVVEREVPLTPVPLRTNLDSVGGALGPPRLR